LHDFSEGQKTELERRRIADEASDALQAKMSLTYDDPESLYRPDGQVDEDKLAAFVSEWTQKHHGVQASFWRAENALKDGYRQQDDADRLNRSIRTAVLGRELQNRRQYFNDNLELAMLKEDWPGAERAVNDAFNGGMLTATQRKVEIMKIRKQKEKVQLTRQEETIRQNPAQAPQLQHNVLSGLKVKKAEPVKEEPKEPAKEPVKEGPKLSSAHTMGGGEAGAYEEPEPDEPWAKAATFGANAAERERVLQLGDNTAAAGTITMNDDGSTGLRLSGAPSDESVRAAARAEARGGYTLEEHQKDVRLAAVGVFSNPNYSALSHEKKVELVQQKVGLIGGADMFFGGSKAEYDGWLKAEVALMRGFGGAAAAADRMVAGVNGQMGINALVLQEVTDEEIAAAWEEQSAHVPKDEGWFSTDEKAKAVRESLYKKYKQEWMNETGETAAEELRNKDVKKFMEWYTKKGGKHSDRRNEFAKALRDVYCERAIVAVLGLRANGSRELRNGQVVKLDGISDWAIEQQVIKDALEAPVTREEYGNMEALVRQREKLAADRKAMAAKFAHELEGRMPRIEEHKHRDFLKRTDELLAEEKAEEDEKARKKREEGFMKKSGYYAEWDGEQVGNDAMPVVALPTAMYAEVAKVLKAGEGGFFVRLPGSPYPVPVKADDEAKNVKFNRTSMPYMKEARLKDRDYYMLVNGCEVKLEFTTNPYGILK
jgi:hypothetical protein